MGRRERRKDAQRSVVSEQQDVMCKCFHLKFCSLPLSQRCVSVVTSDDWSITFNRGQALNVLQALNVPVSENAGLLVDA